MEKAQQVIASGTREARVVSIDATGIPHRELNARLKEAAGTGAEKIRLHNVYGQRYIGTGLNKPVEIEVFGTPGNDLGAFLDGPRIIVRGNAQDGCGNTMNDGEIVVHGRAGDILALSARGGKIFVKGDAGYRAAVHMKEYQSKKPMVVIGGTGQDFLGEYMAGGILVVLGLNLKKGERHKANFIGTGIHGGVIYLRGEVEEFQLGKEVGMAELNESDYYVVKGLVSEFAYHFDYNAETILERRFIKLYPLHLRPYGRLYAY